MTAAVTVFRSETPQSAYRQAVASAESIVADLNRPFDLVECFPVSTKWSLTDIKDNVVRHLNTPAVGDTKVVILVDVDTLTTSILDPLLKPLEELGDTQVFIVLPTSAQLPSTIEGRVQRWVDVPAEKTASQLEWAQSSVFLAEAAAKASPDSVSTFFAPEYYTSSAVSNAFKLTDAAQSFGADALGKSKKTEANKLVRLVAKTWITAALPHLAASRPQAVVAADRAISLLDRNGPAVAALTAVMLA